MTSPTLPNADELEVVAWLDPVPMANGYRVAITAQPIVDRDQWLPCVTLSSAQAQIDRLTRERDEALEQIGAINERALDDVSNLTMRAEAAEAEVKRLEVKLANANVAVDAFSEICDELGVERDNEAGLIAAHSLKEEVKRLREATNQCRLAFSGMVSVQSAIDLLDSTALSGGTSNG
jgi:hypothetical protein